MKSLEVSGVLCGRIGRSVVNLRPCESVAVESGWFSSVLPGCTTGSVIFHYYQALLCEDDMVVPWRVISSWLELLTAPVIEFMYCLSDRTL